MRVTTIGLILCLCGCIFPERLFSSGPNQRTITDPQSVVSPSNLAARPVPIEDLYYTRTVAGASWSPAGRDVVITTDMSGRLNLWRVSAAGGWPIQLAHSDDRQNNAVWSPDGKWIVFQQDKGGNELWDIYAAPSQGGELVNLTNTPDIREESPLWSWDGKMIALNYKPKDATAYDIAWLDWATRQVRKLTHEETKNYSWSAVAWSRDGPRSRLMARRC